MLGSDAVFPVFRRNVRIQSRGGFHRELGVLPDEVGVVVNAIEIVHGEVRRLRPEQVKTCVRALPGSATAHPLNSAHSAMAMAP